MEVLEYSNLGKRDRDYEVQEAAEAARTGIDNARKLLNILSHQQRSQLEDEESDAAAGVAVSKFQKVVSLLSRTGHARFRRAPPNPTISGYEYVFFESANFAQEEELKRIHLEKDHQSREKETINFVPDPLAAPVAPSAAAVASVGAVVPQYPRPSSVSSADGSSGHANSSVPAFLHHAQQLQQQQHLQLRQHQLQVQQQVQQQIQQQLLWQQQHVAPVGFVPVLPTPTDIISFGKQHQQQESSRSALKQEKASRSSQVDNSMSSGPPLSTTTKSGFSVVSMDGSGATDNNLQKKQQQQQTSSALSPAALEPRAQAGGGHHHAATGNNNNKRSSGITSDDNGGAKSSCASVGRCHRSKRRKLRVKRTIKVPAISSKLADIPPDDYSWRKYGQKPIKGSPHPRGYYKCSSMRNCPARKHVERSLEDSSMLIVTYEGEHSHSHTPSTTSTVLNVQS